MADGAPLLSSNPEDQGSTVVYVLHLVNPFDPLNKDLQEDEMTVGKAQKRLLRIFKKKLKYTDGPELLQKLDFIEWTRQEIDKDHKITKKDFIIAVISAIRRCLKVELAVDSDVFSSRDRDELFLRIRVKEDWLQDVAESQNYRLQFVHLKDEEDYKFTKVEAYSPFKTARSGAAANAVTFFKTYDDEDNEDPEGQSRFMYSDKVRIFYTVLANWVDLNVMSDYGVLVDHFPAPQDRPLNKLKHGWGRVGAFYKSQPLDRIRNYFGEKIALYFAWMGVYELFMSMAAVFGLAVFIVQMATDSSSSDSLSASQVLEVLLALFLAIWAASFDQVWTRKEKFLAWRWGTVDFYEYEPPRAEYKAKFTKDPVTGLMKKQSPDPKRYKLKKALSYSIGALFMMLVVCAVAGIFLYRASTMSKKIFGAESNLVCGILNAIQIRIMNIVYGWIAQAMNRWENHETETQYNDNLALKLFLFKFVNSYIALFYIAFFKNTVEGCKDDDCASELSLQLGSIFIINLALNIVELGKPWIKWKLALRKERKKVEAMMKDDPSMRQSMGSIEETAKLEDYDSPLDDYMEMIIQFGYVALFSPVLPIIPVLAMIEIVLEIRVDAWKLCKLTKRPFPHRAEDIGVWKSILRTIACAGVINNAALVIFTLDTFEGQDTLTLWILFIVLEHVLFLLMFLISLAVPDVPDVVKKGLVWGERITNEKLFQSETSVNNTDLNKVLERPRGRSLYPDFSLLLSEGDVSYYE